VVDELLTQTLHFNPLLSPAGKTRQAETVIRLGILYDDSDLLIDYLYHIILSSSIFFHIFLYKIASGWLIKQNQGCSVLQMSKSMHPTDARF
jgi:hypothetical protein